MAMKALSRLLIFVSVTTGYMLPEKGNGPITSGHILPKRGGYCFNPSSILLATETLHRNDTLQKWRIHSRKHEPRPSYTNAEPP